MTFVFATLGLYLFLGAAAVATDGKGCPLGPRWCADCRDRVFADDAIRHDRLAV